MEITLHQLPANTIAEKVTQSETIRWPAMKCLVQKCISHARQNRPSIEQILADLKAFN